MTYEEIFSKTKELVDRYDVSEVNEHIAVQINITGEGEGAFYIEIKDGRAYIEPYEYYDRDCIFITSGENFLKICDGSMNAVLAFTLGKLKVEGSLEKALTFAEIAEKARKNDKKASKKKSK